MHLFKKTIFILLLFLSSLLAAQDASKNSLDQYNELINYIPKSLEKDTIYNPEIRISEIAFNSILNVKLHYGLKHFTKFTTNEIAWMEDKIEKLAIALHSEGKYILMGQTVGCEIEHLIEEIHLNNIKITNLNFCYGCTDGYIDDDFIEIFNSKMYQLLQIRQADFKTHHFFGIYKGKSENSSETKLILTKDRLFKFWVYEKYTTDFSEGIWENRNDTLILKPQEISHKDSLHHLLYNGSWIPLHNVKYRLKRKKLIELEMKKIKFKRAL